MLNNLYYETPNIFQTVRKCNEAYFLIYQFITYFTGQTKMQLLAKYDYIGDFYVDYNYLHTISFMSKYRGLKLKGRNSMQILKKYFLVCILT